MSYPVLRSALSLSLSFAAITTAFAADAPKKRAITLDDLVKEQRVSAPVVSPDGAWVPERKS